VPLLSDPESKVIREFGILNDTLKPDQPGYGVPFPVTYFVNERGIVVSKFFERDFRERYAMGTVYTRLFGSPLNTRQTVINNSHLRLKYFSSADIAAAGNRLMLIADITLKPGMHVYAPGVQGYKGLDWKLGDSPHISQRRVKFPRPQTLYLPVIKERVPVYEGRLRITQEIDLDSNYQKVKPALDVSNQLTIGGSLSYQACDDRICYPPQRVPLKWTIRLVEPDRERVSEQFRKK
jgi:DsbC/DsbD-like thiol-disulfide interchange protein